MKEQTKSQSRTYDTPIPKPPDELFEKFMRSTEARLVTRRFRNDGESARRNDRIETR